MAELHFIREGDEVLRLRLDGSPKIIGRHGSPGLPCFLDPDVSREHFTIRREGVRWLLRNLSRFGTLVDGKEVRGEIELSRVTVLEFGRWRAEFHQIGREVEEKAPLEGESRRRTLTLRGWHPARRTPSARQETR